MNTTRSGGLVLATVLAVMAPTTAEANTHRGMDAAQDVVQFHEDQTTTPVPDRADGDILRTSVRHGKRQVTLAMSYANLTSPSSDNEFGMHIFRILTNRQPIRELRLETTATRPYGTLTIETPNGHAVKCRGQRWTVSYARHFVRVSVPRRCLGRPRWVRVGMATAKANTTRFAGYIDDAGTSGAPGLEPKWGPRVYR